MTPPPSLADLTARFLRSSAAAADASEVEPHEVLGGFRAPALDLWADAHAAVAARTPGALPPEWAAFAALDAAAQLPPFAAGFYPQRLRQLAALGQLLGAATRGAAVAGFSALRRWVAAELASKQFERTLIASGVAATLGDLDAARRAVDVLDVTANQRPAWDNQRGVLAWLAGDRESAVALWRTAGDAAPARFNLGVAALAAGDKSGARGHFQAAAAGLAGRSGWSHLTQLCLALTGE